MTTIRIELALLRLSWKLRRGVEPARRRAIRRELRAHLRASAAEVGWAEALSRLGDLDELAREYREAERGLPRGLRIGSGIVAAVSTWVLLVVLDGRTIMSWNDLESRGDFDPWSWTLGAPNGKASLLTFSGDVEHELLLDVSVHRLGYILLPLLAFLVGARAWRALHRPRSLPPRWRRASSA
jgi:hypothetical protein